MEKNEKIAISFSLIFGILMFLIEIILSIITNSQAMFMDTFYDGIDIIIVILMIFLIKLYNKPISERKPFGFTQLESFFLLIKTFMMIILNTSIIIDAIGLIYRGGNKIDSMQISIFQFILFSINCFVWLGLRKYNKNTNSPTIKSEVIAWKSDTVYSFGLSFSFFIINLLEKVGFGKINLYVDQIVVIVSSLIMIPELFKVLKENMFCVLLFTPINDETEVIKKIINKILKNSNMNITHYDIVKTGRKYWISIYFKSFSDFINLSDLKRYTNRCSKELNKKIGNVYFELVPDVGNYYD